MIFYKYFLHSYIKRENSRFCTDILLQTYLKYPEYLKIALKVILKDLDIPNSVFKDFILNLNPINQSDLLETLSDIQFTAEEFSHNIFNIYTAYKSCSKTDSIQKYIISCLKIYSNFCYNDKNFGRIFLAYLQFERCMKRNVDCSVLEDLIERHKSPFKRPMFVSVKRNKRRKINFLVFFSNLFVWQTSQPT